MISARLSAGPPRPYSLPGALVSVLLLCLFIGQPAFAQSVWRLDIASEPAAAYLNVDALESLAVGDTFMMRVDVNEEYPIRIDRTNVASNGDHSWYGSITNTGLDYALTITVGDKTAHLILTSPSGIFQYYGIRSGTEIYAGGFNRLDYVRDEVAITDTILVNEDGPQGAGTLPSFQDMLLEQSVSEAIVPLGSKLTFTLDIKNGASGNKNDLYLDVFFVLENTSLDALPQDCEILESTDSQPVLSCYLGDLAGGQEKQVSFTVTTTEDSHPLVYSTAIVDEIRSDAIVEVYRDVVTDTDQDGVSDYNEELLGTDPLDALDTDDRDAVIDVLVAYTPEVNDLYRGEVETRINQLFNVANKIFEDSQAGIALRPVGVQELDYEHAETLLEDLEAVTYMQESDLKDLERQRSLFGGDLVVLFRTGEINGLCGLANLGGNGTQGDLSAPYHRDYAVSVINIDCGDDSVLAHEVGHNLGLVHSRREDPAGGTFPWSSGYGVDERFVSIMAFPEDYDVVNRLYRFSDPQRLCGGPLCGAGKDDNVNGADAVSTLKLVKYQVEDYYPSQESRIRTLNAISNQGGVIKASLGVAAYTTTSTDFTGDFSSSDLINLRMKISPLPGQIGQQFTTHLVLMDGKNRLLQANLEGEFIPWNGALNSLEAVTPAREMCADELFDVAVGIDPDDLELEGSTLKVFVAYRMVETGELVYGAKPLSLTIAD